MVKWAPAWIWFRRRRVKAQNSALHAADADAGVADDPPAVMRKGVVARVRARPRSKRPRRQEKTVAIVGLRRVVKATEKTALEAEVVSGVARAVADASAEARSPRVMLRRERAKDGVATRARGAKAPDEVSVASKKFR